VVSMDRLLRFLHFLSALHPPSRRCVRWSCTLTAELGEMQLRRSTGPRAVACESDPSAAERRVLLTRTGAGESVYGEGTFVVEKWLNADAWRPDDFSQK